MKLSFHTDGSARPNPGFGGYGVFGFSYTESDRPKKHKHPITNLYFTREGLTKEKSPTPIEVFDIYEVIYTNGTRTSTNNELELLAFIKALTIARDTPELDEVTINADSNYVIKNFNENLDAWAARGWRTVQGSPIAQTALWEDIKALRDELQAKGVVITLIWVKAHNGDYTNELVDYYSVLGSLHGPDSDSESGFFLLDAKYTHAEFKASFPGKHFTHFFKDMYFVPSLSESANYTFLSATPEDELKGQRNNASIYALIVGKIPEEIEALRNNYCVSHPHVEEICIMRVQKLADRDLARTTKLLGPRIVLDRTSEQGAVRLVKDTESFIYKTATHTPFIMNTRAILNFLELAHDFYIDHREGIGETQECREFAVFDITSRIIDQGKLLIKNSDKFLDVSDCVQSWIETKQKPVLSLGHDLPPYLALSTMADEIDAVHLVAYRPSGVSYLTLAVVFVYGESLVLTTAVKGKYLI